MLPSTTANTSKLAEKVLDSTINIPPLIYQNQGGIVGIYVARDVDFSSVYELRPTAVEAKPQASRERDRRLAMTPAGGKAMPRRSSSSCARCASSSMPKACSKSASTGPASCWSRPSRGWQVVACDRA